MSSVCAIRRTIAEISGSADFESDEKCVKVGGVDVIYDDTTFYISRRKLQLARYEVGGTVIPSARFAGMESGDVFMKLMGEFEVNKTLRQVLRGVVDAVADFEATVIGILKKDPLALGKNITLPCIRFDSFESADISVVSLALFTNRFINYVNGIRIENMQTRTNIETILLPINAVRLRKFVLGTTAAEILEGEIEIVKVIDCIHDFHRHAIKKINATMEQLINIIGFLRGF
jgi:hypothetical protein